MTGKRKRHKRQAAEVIRAIIQAHGIKASAARILGCTRSTLDTYIRDMPTVAAAYEETTESLLDAAESVLFHKALVEKDVSSLRYLLDAKGRSRGYGRRPGLLGLDEMEGGARALVIDVVVPEPGRIGGD